MKMVRSVVKFRSPSPKGRKLVYMHGYGGFIWQASRHIKILLREGYDVTAIDFKDILRNKNPQDLLTLMDEVEAIFKNEDLIDSKTLILGISLGGLAGLNMLRRHPELDKILVVTGGDITRLPFKRTLHNKWHLTREELSKIWEPVNMYSRLGALKDKHITMFLPARDKIIDPDEVRNEITKHSKLNDIKLITSKGGHFRTILSKTILTPRQTLPLLHELENY